MASFVYVLGCRAKDRTLTYVGWTTDVDRRLTQHNAGAGARFTRGRAWVLLHVERFRTRRQAMRREWRLKRDRSFRKKLTLLLDSGPEAYSRGLGVDRVTSCQRLGVRPARASSPAP